MKRKLIYGIIAAVVVVGGIVTWKKVGSKAAPPRYVLAAASKETVIVSVSGSGQISSSNQLDLKSKASGDILVVNVVNGQEVKAGTVIARINATDALKAVRDAKASLETARLSLEKVRQPAEALTLLQAENNFAQAKETKQKAEADLAKAYEDAFSSVANAFLDLPGVMTGLHNALMNNTINTIQGNMDFYADAAKTYDENALTYRDDAYNSYLTARAAYDTSFSLYKTTSRASERSAVETLLASTYDASKKISQAVKSATNLIQFYQDKLTERGLHPVVTAASQIADLNAFTSKVNTRLNDLLSFTRTLTVGKQSLIDADRTIAESGASLDKIKLGADVLDIRSAELNVQDRTYALTDAENKLADYTIRAPFEGTIAKVPIKRGDSASTGTVMVTLLAKQRTADISLNEIDVAKIKLAQKANLTFDALPDLSISGTVGDIDTLGTVSQGVVTYNVKILFDTQDDRVKPGMSASTAVTTDVKQDVLTVPNTAVKLVGNVHFVEVLDGVTEAGGNQGITSETAPRMVMVEVGLASDTLTEITSGLKEGDLVVARTITGTTGASTSTAPSLFGGGAQRGAGGGNATFRAR